MAPGAPLRILFAGTPDFAAHYLSFLLDQGKHEIIGVYTQPDRPAGRGKKLKASPVKQLAENNSLPVFQPTSLKTSDDQEQLKALDPDLMLVVAYGLILPQAVLDIPKYGCINVHASILPRWRGAAPIQRAIEAGDDKSGVTIMQMSAGLDTGDMLKIAECEINAVETAGSLHDKLAQVGEAALAEALDELSEGRLVGTQQDDSLSTYAPKISKQEAQINWAESAETIDRKIRAFHPFPIAHFETKKGNARVHTAFRLTEAIETSSSPPPGTLLKANNNGIDIAAGDGVIRIKKLQLPGKKAMDAGDVVRGNQNLFAPGNQFPLPQPIDGAS